MRLVWRTLIIVVTALSGAAAIAQSSTSPLRIGRGPHLLVDDYLVASSPGVTRVIESPVRPAAPAIGGLPGPAQFASIPSISWDARLGKFRMWYTERAAGGDRLLYRESADGLNWPGPDQVSLVLQGDGPSVMDEGGDVPDPSRRFKLVYFRNVPRPIGMSVAWSGTGLSWTFSPQNPVHPYYEITDPRFPSGVGDILDPFYDPIRRRYGALVKVYTNPGNEFGLQGRTHPPGLGIRLTGVMTSPDFEHWTPPRRAYVPDTHDRGTTELYGGPVVPRGELLLNFLRILRDDLPAEPNGPVEGIGYTVLAWSRDGVTWHRDRIPFFDRNPVRGSWDRAMTWIYGAAMRDGTVYLSYAGYDLGHKVGNRQIGIATIARDRFVAREPVGESGTLRTPLLMTARPEGLWLNANAAGGTIEVKVFDANGMQFLGECAALRVEGHALPVTCGKSLASEASRPFSLEFRISRSKLYGFSFTPTP